MAIFMSWLDLYCFSSWRKFRRFLMLGAAIFGFSGSLLATLVGTATAWRAAGFPSVATETYVKSFVGEQIAPLSKQITMLDSRSNDLFSIQQATLTKVSDPDRNSALIEQITNILLAQKRIEDKLGEMRKPHR